MGVAGQKARVSLIWLVYTHTISPFVVYLSHIFTVYSLLMFLYIKLQFTVSSQFIFYVQYLAIFLLDYMVF